MLEVLPLDLYFNVQVRLTRGQNAGDHHLELTEHQVSPGSELRLNLNAPWGVRNGRL